VRTRPLARVASHVFVNSFHYRSCGIYSFFHRQLAAAIRSSFIPSSPSYLTETRSGCRSAGLPCFPSATTHNHSVAGRAHATIPASTSPSNPILQARAAELEQQVDAPAAQVPTYSQLLCPFTLSCPRSSLYSSIDSVSIEMLARRAQHPSAMSIGNLPPAVHASGHVDADFDGPWGQASPLQRFKIVWRRLVPSYIVVLGVYFATSFIFFKCVPRPLHLRLPTAAHASPFSACRYVIYDSEGRVKPVKGSCFSLAEMQENLCVFAAGQGAYGLIAFGQAAVGLIVIAQGSVGMQRQCQRAIRPPPPHPTPLRHNSGCWPGRTFPRVFCWPGRHRLLR
jgi:hypothetical protein